MALLEEIQTLASDSTRRVAQEWCARPLAKRVTRDAKYGWQVLHAPTAGRAGRWADERDADARYTAACPEYALALAEAEAEVKRLDAVDAAEAEAAEARKAALREAWREWALTRPELAPAAEDGYDVIGAVADDVAAHEVQFWLVGHEELVARREAATQFVFQPYVEMLQLHAAALSGPGQSGPPVVIRVGSRIGGARGAVNRCL